MTPPLTPPTPTRPLGKVEKNLRKLHRRGLREPQLDDLTELLAVARNLSSKPTDREMVEDALTQGIDACWGGSRADWPTLRDTIRLWFGLPAVDDPTAPDTHTLTSTARHEAAWGYWVQRELEKGEKPREVEGTFRTSNGTKRYEALTKKLCELEAIALSGQQPLPAIPEPQEQSVQLPLTPQGTQEVFVAAEPVRRRYAKPITLLAVVAAATAGLIVWAPWAGSGASIPPLGAVVNAETGKWSMNVPITPAEPTLDVGNGPSNFRGCNISTEHTCKFRPNITPIKAHVGDTLEFAVRLNNGREQAIPYVKLQASLSYIGVGRSETARFPATKYSLLGVFMNASWPSSGELGAGPVITRHTGFNEIFVQPPSVGSEYTLSYMPGTSTIRFPETHFFYHLPDGIMQSGIALEDVGVPPSCPKCATKYIRVIAFKVKVIQH